MVNMLFALLLILAADEPAIPAEKAATIERQQQKAQTEVNAKYGNKKLNEMSADERRAMMKDQAAAERAVLEKNGVDAKTWAKESQNKTRAEAKDHAERVKALEAQEKKDAEAAAKAKQDGNKDVTVQRGFSDEEPVTLEEKENEDGQVSVEKSLPPDVAADQAAASEQDRLENSGDATDGPRAAPAKGGGGKGGKGGRRR